MDFGNLRSDYQPLRSSKDRSSWGDIAFRMLGKEFSIKVKTSDKNVTFDIMRDISNHKDKVILKNAKDGSTFVAHDGMRYYIANPKNVSSQFEVSFSDSL